MALEKDSAAVMAPPVSILDIINHFPPHQKRMIDPFGVFNSIEVAIQTGSADPILTALFTMKPAPLSLFTQPSADEFDLASQYKDPLAITPEVKVTSTRAKNTKKRAVSAGRVQKKVKRSVNCYMTFRSFYSTIFKAVPQRHISVVLKPIWDKDPFQSKWILLAKAYSLVRNAMEASKRQPSLEAFLSASKELIGLVPAEEYLSVMGWTIIETDSGPRAMRLFEVDLNSLDENFTQCDCSINDLVESFYELGHIPEEVYRKCLHPNMGVMGQTMVSSFRDVVSRTATGDNELEFSHDAVAGSKEIPSQPKESQASSPILSNTHQVIAIGSNQQSMESVLESSGMEFPFNDAFTPSPSELDLIFGPFEGDAYNSFEMTQYVAPGSALR